MRDYSTLEENQTLHVSASAKPYATDFVIEQLEAGTTRHRALYTVDHWKFDAFRDKAVLLSTVIAHLRHALAGHVERRTSSNNLVLSGKSIPI